MDDGDDNGDKIAQMITNNNTAARVFPKTLLPDTS